MAMATNVLVSSDIEVEINIKGVIIGIAPQKTEETETVNRYDSPSEFKSKLEWENR